MAKMKPTYRIKDWDKHFENHESRKVKRAYWVPIPNRHDGKSYRRIASHPEGVAVFAAWTLILEVASKMPDRGVLADEDGPLDSEDLAAMTGFPAPIFDAAFNLLTQQRFGWLTSSATRQRAAKSPATSRNLPESPDVTGEPASELNGTELNGKEGDGTGSAKAGASAVQIPKGVSTEDFTIWNLGVGKLMATGNSERDARAFLGEQNKTYGKSNVARAVTEMLAHEPAEPKSYIVAVLKSQNGLKAGASKVDRSMAAVREVMEEYKHGN